jgi:hypothetical protein
MLQRLVSIHASTHQLMGRPDDHLSFPSSSWQTSASTSDFRGTDLVMAARLADELDPLFASAIYPSQFPRAHMISSVDSSTDWTQDPDIQAVMTNPSEVINSSGIVLPPSWAIPSSLSQDEATRESSTSQLSLFSDYFESPLESMASSSSASFPISYTSSSVSFEPLQLAPISSGVPGFPLGTFQPPQIVDEDPTRSEAGINKELTGDGEV